MIRKLLLLLLLPALPAISGVIVAPNTYTNGEAPTDTVGPLSPSSFSVQYLLASSQFAGISAGTQLTGIGFRLDGGLASGPASAVSFDSFQLTLSPSLVAVGSLSPTFANNTGAGAVMVISGPRTILSNALTGGATPNPFLFLSFSSNYTYTGGDLLITLETISTTGGPAIDVDAFSVGALGDSVIKNGTAHYFNVPVMAFQYSAAAAVPEPGTVVMLGIGLGLLALRRLF